MTDEWKEVTTVWRGDSAFSGFNLAGGQVLMGTLAGEPGLSPMELILAGLAGCTGVDVVSILQKKRQNLQDLHIVVRGKRANEHPRVYRKIEINFLVWGENLDPRAVEQAIDLSKNKYCSVSAMLAATADIHVTYRILAPGEVVEISGENGL